MKTLRFIIILSAIVLALGLGWYILHTKKLLARTPADGSIDTEQPAGSRRRYHFGSLTSQPPSDG